MESIKVKNVFVVGIQITSSTIAWTNMENLSLRIGILKLAALNLKTARFYFQWMINIKIRASRR